MQKNLPHHVTRGIALYLAILVGAVFAATAMGVAAIFYREVRISKLFFPSLTAFYAADTGAECALYGHIKQNLFDFNIPSNRTITCTNTSVPVTWNAADTYYEFSYNIGSGACVNVEIRKRFVPACFKVITRIDSFGTNAPCGGTPNVERGLVIFEPESCSFTP